MDWLVTGLDVKTLKRYSPLLTDFTSSHGLLVDVIASMFL